MLLPAVLLVTAGFLSKNLEQQAREIHERILTIDTHTDTPLMLGNNGLDLGKHNNPRERGGKLDFPRMEEGGLDAAFFAVFLSQGETSPDAFAVAKDRAFKTFSLIEESLQQNRHLASMATHPDDAYRLKKEGKKAVYIGLENAYPIGEDFRLLERFYDMGTRYITLCHTRNNHFSDSSTDPDGPWHGGLSDMGFELVRRMNDQGMIVDVSHISDEAFWDVIRTSKAPVIASHSNARAVHDDPRNLDDEMITALAENGGVIQLCFLYVKQMPPNPPRDSARASLREKYNNFQNLTDEQMEMARNEWYAIDREYPSQLPTVADFVDHLDHVVKLVGIDFVGIGTDFDGGGQLEDCYDVSEMHNITVEMLRRGYTEEEIEKVWSGNFMRVFRENLALRNKD